MGSHRLAPPDLIRIFRGDTIFGLSEWQLLERYLERRDEIAFEALVARHGPMVLGVCRRMLANPADVDDAFQATFLVLVRRARQLGPRDAIGPWLHGVAIRVAHRARSEAGRRRQFDTLDVVDPAASPDCSLADRELAAILDQELSRLPSKYRSPLVLCYLEGQTHEQAAAQLRWPIGTVKGRLARARDLLRSRLVRRGVAPTAGALTLALASESSASLHPQLLNRTVQLSLNNALGQATAQVASSSITSLVEGVLTAMLVNKLKWIGLTVVVASLALTGAGVLAQPGAKRPSRPLSTAIASSNSASMEFPAQSESPDGKPSNPMLDHAVKPPDPYQELLRAARAAYQATLESFVNGHASAEQVYQASRRWMDAQKETATTTADEVNAISAHRDRIRDLARADVQRNKIIPGYESVASAEQERAYLAESEVWLAQARAGKAEKASDTRSGPGNDPQSRRIHAKLELALTMSFAEETPLDDVLKHIKQATKSTELPKGIPIYVDPIALQEAEKSLTSTITMDLDGVPLRRTLQLLLKQLGLVYYVYDGMLHITSEESEDTNPTLEPSPIEMKIAKAVRGELALKEMKELQELMKCILEISKAAGDHRMIAAPEGAGGLQ
jgi:RNA polymerase sigma factor (sigma-70 family)